MTRFVLDKNPELDFIKVFESHILNLIMHSDPFLKQNFLNKIILTTNYPVIYLDIDLLFSGYVTSKIITPNQGLTIFQPNRQKLLDIIKTILLEISKKKSMLIIDSLNGLFNLYHENKDAGRLVNSYIMLFVSIAKNSNSKVIISGMTRRKNNEEWVLSITGRHVFESKKMTLIQLERKNSNIIANLLDGKNLPQKSFSIPAQSEWF